MSIRTANERLCDYCEELLGQISVETLGGHIFHADCYDKWRKDIAAAEVSKVQAFNAKRGEA